MAMRMQQLSERSGLPKTTIHHYMREDLLPPARKTAPNAAEYDEAHLERLRLITRLRAAEFGELSIPEIRRVLEHVEAGVSVHAAVRLVEADVESVVLAGGGWESTEELAAAAAAPIEFVETLVGTGVVDRLGGAGFGPGDLLVVRACHALAEDHGIDPGDLSPIADLIREVGNYSATLMDVHAATADSRNGSVVDRRRLRDQIADCCRAFLWRAVEA